MYVANKFAFSKTTLTIATISRHLLVVDQIFIPLFLVAFAFGLDERVVYKKLRLHTALEPSPLPRLPELAASCNELQNKFS